MAVCISCGKELGEGVKFCIHCGTPQDAAPEEKVETVAAVSAAEPEQKAAESAPLDTEYIPKLTFSEKPAPEPAPVIVPPEQYQEQRRDSARSAAAEPPAPAAAVSGAESHRPGKKSRWAAISTLGYIGIDLLMAIPVVGLILTIIWACGGCRKYAKRSYARSKLIYIFIAVLLTVGAALVIRFAFPELIVQTFEFFFPGYTIVF